MSGQRLKEFLSFPLFFTPPPMTPTQTLLPGTYAFPSERSVATSSLEVQTAEILPCSAFCSCLNCKMFMSCKNLRSPQKRFPATFYYTSEHVLCMCRPLQMFSQPQEMFQFSPNISRFCSHNVKFGVILSATCGLQGTVAVMVRKVKHICVVRETEVMDFKDMYLNFRFIASVDWHHVCCMQVKLDSLINIVFSSNKSYYLGILLQI